MGRGKLGTLLTPSYLVLYRQSCILPIFYLPALLSFLLAPHLVQTLPSQLPLQVTVQRGACCKRSKEASPFFLSSRFRTGSGLWLRVRDHLHGGNVAVDVLCYLVLLSGIKKPMHKKYRVTQSCDQEQDFLNSSPGLFLLPGSSPRSPCDSILLLAEADACATHTDPKLPYASEFPFLL